MLFLMYQGPNHASCKWMKNEGFLKFQRVCHRGMDLMIGRSWFNSLISDTSTDISRSVWLERVTRGDVAIATPQSVLRASCDVLNADLLGRFFWRPVNIVYASFTQNRRSVIAMCKPWLTQITGSERESGRRRWKSERWKIQRRKRRQGRIQRRNKRGSHFSGYLRAAVRAAASLYVPCRTMPYSGEGIQTVHCAVCVCVGIVQLLTRLTGSFPAWSQPKICNNNEISAVLTQFPPQRWPKRIMIT